MKYIYSLLIISLFSSLAYSQANSVSAVSWVLYDRRSDFKEAPALIEKFLCSEESQFSVCKENLFKLDRDAPICTDNEKPGSYKSFETQLTNALNFLDDKESTLILAISSHGLKNEICRQSLPNIKHEDFIQLLFQKIDETQKNKDIKVHLIFFYSACYSETMLEPIKKYTQDNTGEYCDGADRYKYKVDLYTSASANLEGARNVFWDLLLSTTQPKEKSLEDREKYWLSDSQMKDYFLQDPDNSTQLWSSYKDIKPFIINSLIFETIKQTNDPDVNKRKQVVAYLTNIGTIEVIPYLGKFVKDVAADIRISAIQGLAGIGTPEVFSYLESVVTDIDSEVRKEAIKALASIGFLEVIPYLGKAALEDIDKDVKIVALHALYNIGISKMVHYSEVIPYIGRALKDKIAEVRKNAVFCLDGKNPLIIPYLKEACEDPDKGVRAAALTAFYNADTPEAFPYIEKATHDSDPEISAISLMSLSELKKRYSNIKN